MSGFCLGQLYNEYMGFIYYTIWPWVKVKGIYYWWIIKYRGKKNIPPELIFSAMARSMSRMTENLQMAIRTMPDDVTDEEKEQMWQLLGEADRLEEEVRRVKTDKFSK
jgi:hypothetical protein